MFRAILLNWLAFLEDRLNVTHHCVCINKDNIITKNVITFKQDKQVSSSKMSKKLSRLC